MRVSANTKRAETMSKRRKMPAEHAYTNANFERSAPKHPAGHDPGIKHAYGYSEEPLRSRRDGNMIGSDFPANSSNSRPAVLTLGQHGYPGASPGMGSKSHGFGHTAHQRHGALRMSGNPSAHRIGSRKK